MAGIHFLPKFTPVRADERPRDNLKQPRAHSPPRKTAIDFSKTLASPKAEVAVHVSLFGSSPKSVVDDSVVYPTALLRDYYNDTSTFCAETLDMLQSRQLNQQAGLIKRFQEESVRWVADYKRLFAYADKGYANLYAIVLKLVEHFQSQEEPTLPSEVICGSLSAQLEDAMETIQREVNLESSTVPWGVTN